MPVRDDHKPPPKAPRIPTVAEYRAYTDYLQANADRNVAQTITNLNNNQVMPAIDKAVQVSGFSKPDLVVLSHFESSGGVTNKKKTDAKQKSDDKKKADTSNTAEGPFQYNQLAFYDGLHRLVKTDSDIFKNLAAIDPAMADHLAAAHADVTVARDRNNKSLTDSKGNPILSAGLVADEFYRQHKDDPFIQSFFITGNLQRHAGNDAGDPVFLRVTHNLGPGGLEKIRNAMQANAGITMGELFKKEPQKLIANKIPADLPVGDFWKREVGIYNLYVQHAELQLAGNTANPGNAPLSADSPAAQAPVGVDPPAIAQTVPPLAPQKPSPHAGVQQLKQKLPPDVIPLDPPAHRQAPASPGHKEPVSIAKLIR